MEGILLEATKLILAQNNLHAGSLNKKDIETLNIQPANAQVEYGKGNINSAMGRLFQVD